MVGRRYFMGVAAGRRGQAWRYVFTRGSRRDCAELERYLLRRYGGRKAILCKNGRSALARALMEYVEPGSSVIINGFTCHAVVEAVEAAGCKPVYADITRGDLNYNYDTLAAALDSDSSRHAATRPSLRGSAALSAPVVADGRKPSEPQSRKHGAVIIQNTLGNPVDIRAVERFAREHDLVIIEDLAHCVGVRYADGREAGTVGVAAALSFGKEKSVDTTSGGAVVYRAGKENAIGEIEGVRSLARRGKAPSARGDGPDGRDPRFANSVLHLARPKPSDTLRARFYPLFGAIYRGLSYVRLGGVFMRSLLKIHWVERSADNKLDLERGIAPFEAKLALEQLKGLRGAQKPLREFYLVDNRDEVLAELRKNGYYFDGFWYEKPISPARYYQRVHFPEEKCPVAVQVSAKIINFPAYYSKKELKKAHEIVKKVGIPWTGVATEVKGARSKVPQTGADESHKEALVTEVNKARPKVPQTERSGS